MSFSEIHLDRILLTLFMSVRFGALFISLPFFSELRIGMVLHLIIPVGIAGLISSSVPVPVWGAISSNGLLLALSLINEFLIGTILGFAVRILFSIAQFAGEFAGIQVGFSMASIFDPSFGHISSLSQFAGICIVLCFFVFDTHHDLISTLARSYNTLPPGIFYNNFYELAVGLTKMMSALFSLGCRFALPIAAVILISHLINGFISITAPQLNLYFNAAIALNIGIGLFIMVLGIGTLLRFFDSGVKMLHDFITHFFGVIV